MTAEPTNIQITIARIAQRADAAALELGVPAATILDTAFELFESSGYPQAIQNIQACSEDTRGQILKLIDHLKETGKRPPSPALLELAALFIEMGGVSFTKAVEIGVDMRAALRSGVSVHPHDMQKAFEHVAKLAPMESVDEDCARGFLSGLRRPGWNP
jgi:hypothetical protein